MPDGTRSQRQTLYNGEGWKTEVSERGLAGTTRPATVYSGFDPFGRPGFIRPAEGSQHTVELDYAGVRQVDRRVWSSTDRNSSGQLLEEQVTTQELYDGLGRLYKVRDHSNPASPSTLVDTTYSYDQADRLTQVNQNGQLRTFTYKVYFYTADDERIYALAYAVGNWSLTKDYIYRGGSMLAHVTIAGATVHYTLDHLGTTRMLTSGAGSILRGVGQPYSTSAEPHGTEC